MAGFKRLLFKRRKTQPKTETTTATATITPSPAVPPPTHAPPPEDTADRQPPPYSPSSASQPEPNIRVSGLLDPNLNFTAAQMQQQWRAKDKRFASAVVQFVAERFDGKLKGWAGYKYTYICEDENPPRKESAWDDSLGFNAWGYRGRYKFVSALAKRDFERRGFEVRKCEVYSSMDGIYVEWSLDLRDPTT